ncbi:MAG: iron chelate uptake ABC transporter family permease subunit [Acidimicrobiales bacterium]
MSTILCTTDLAVGHGGSVVVSGVGLSVERARVVAALLGALVVVVADALGRSLFAPTELPVGLVVSLVGTPFFLHLIWRTRTVAAM